MEGWSILVEGEIQKFPNFAKTCMLVLANRNLNGTIVQACMNGWRSYCRNLACVYVDMCLLYATALSLGKPFAAEVGTLCRAAWHNEYAAFAEDCEHYIDLSARNPRARGIAAWVVEDTSFAFVSRSAMHPQPCAP